MNSTRDSATGESALARRARRLAVGCDALVALTLALMVLGALVRAHGAGLACPDWPLCFGEFAPRMDLKVGFEWTHRVVAATVALLFAALVGFALREPATRRAARGLLALTAALLCLQILLGALTVWLKLAVWTVTAHLVTANAFAVALLLAGVRLRELTRPNAARAPIAPASRAFLLGAGALLLGQIVLGGLVSSSQAGLACPEWPTCNGGHWFPSFGGSVGLHLLHRLNGYGLLLLLLAAAFAARRDPALGRLAAAAAGLGCAQIAVGVANVLLGLPVEITGLHSALAAALVLVVARALREAVGAPRPALVQQRADEVACAPTRSSRA